MDLQHPRRSASQAEKNVYRIMVSARDYWAVNTTPIPLKQGERWRCRYAFGYGLDGSDLPCFLLRPERTEINSFGVVNCSTAAFYDLRATRSIENLGLEHFYAAFRLRSSRDVRSAAAKAFGFNIESISEDCSVGMDIARPLQLIPTLRPPKTTSE